MQQKELSLPRRVICIAKMPLEFGNVFCLPCEPIAWIWHEGNDTIRCCPIAMIAVVDVHLPNTINLVHQNISITTILLTELAEMNMLSRATKW